MKKFIKKMPLDVFIDRMNSLGKPFAVEVFFCSDKEDFGSAWLECDLIGLRGVLMVFKGNHSVVHTSRPCEFVEWNDDRTMMRYVLKCENAIVCVCTPDGKPLKEI